MHYCDVSSLRVFGPYDTFLNNATSMMHFKCPWIQCRTYFLHWVYPLMIQPPNLPQEIADIPRTPITVFSLRGTVY